MSHACLSVWTVCALVFRNICLSSPFLRTLCIYMIPFNFNLIQSRRNFQYTFKQTKTLAIFVKENLYRYINVSTFKGWSIWCNLIFAWQIWIYYIRLRGWCILCGCLVSYSRYHLLYFVTFRIDQWRWEFVKLIQNVKKAPHLPARLHIRKNIKTTTCILKRKFFKKFLQAQ